MSGFPRLSFGLAAFTCLLAWLPESAQRLLYFEHEGLIHGEWWRLVTGHWMHADLGHLFWNVIGLLVLGVILERRSAQLLAWSVAAGVVAVDLLLISPFSTLQRYCGLSGVLNTLLGVALYIIWRENRSPLVLVSAVICMAKIVLEVALGRSVITDISWPPYAVAHVAGVLGAVLVLLLYRHNNKSITGPVPQPRDAS